MFNPPEDFLQFLRDTYGIEAANAWFQRLPSLLEECAERWQLKLLPPFENLSFHYVAPAERADGTPVILKTCSLTDEFAHGVAALRIFDGRGIARLDMRQVEARWDEVREWMRGVLRTWVQRYKMLNIERHENGIRVEIETQDDCGYYLYGFDVFPGRKARAESC